jgi:uncharacterized protein YndB with AHSA1/START domain
VEVCPSEIIHAPAERIWQLLMDPAELAQWSGTKLVKGPARPLRTGDLLVVSAGVMSVSIEVLNAQPPQTLRLYVRLPFGVVNHEQVEVTPVGSRACRVTFN